MKRAIIFGSTGGIGRAISQELAADGWSLYLHFNKQETQAQEMASSLTAQYPLQDFITLKLDFNSNDSGLAIFASKLLPVNALVFAQGITAYNFLGDQDLGTIEKVLNVNLLVPIKLTKLLEKSLVKHDFSRIVYLGSVYGANGSALEAVYSASKAGLTRFSQAYAREISSTNLTVNVVAPGAVDTQMNAMLSKEALDEVKDEIPLGRFADPNDVSFWVKVLLSQRSAYLTGQTIYVSGGWLL